MSEDYFTALFYSKNENLFLAGEVKKLFKDHKIFTSYSSDIDDIILKRIYPLDLLVLDFTDNLLDDRSVELLSKLKKSKYINEIVIFVKNEDFSYSDFEQIKIDEKFSINISNLAKKVSSHSKIITYDSSWIKIISSYLDEIGISSKYYGYMLLIDAITFYLSQHGDVKSLSKNLYPFLALKYKLNNCTLEMRLRNAICMASKNSTNFPFKDCPTIKQFLIHSIAQVYERIYKNSVINLNNIE